MLKDITLGQYFPGHSVIHRLDPRTKLIMLVVYIVALFLAKSWVSYALMLAFLVWVIQISTIPPKAIVRGMKEAGIHIPVVAIGGITVDDIPSIMGTGVDGIALSGAVLNAEDPAAMTEKIITAIRQSKNEK